MNQLGLFKSFNLHKRNLAGTYLFLAFPFTLVSFKRVDILSLLISQLFTSRSTNNDKKGISSGVIRSNVLVLQIAQVSNPV